MKPSLSKSALIISGCTAWMQPGAKHYEDEYADTTKRDKGTLFHRLIDQYIKGEQVDLGEVPAGWNDVIVWYRQACVYFDSVIRPRASWVFSEVAFSVDFAECRAEILHDVDDRNYPDEPGRIYGTADLIWMREDGTLVVQDWKTGGTGGAKEQLLSLTLAYCWSLGDESTVEAQLECPIINEALVVNEAGVWPETYEVEDCLDRHAVLMAKALEKADPVTREGIHCTVFYCPHLAFCPAIDKVVDEAAEDAEPKGPAVLPAERLTQKFKVQTPILNDEHAGYVMSRVSAAKRRAAYLEEACKEHVARGGKVLSGGFEWSKKADGFRWRRI